MKSYLNCDPSESNIIFHKKDNKEPIMEIKSNGDILVKGKNIEQDIDVYYGLCELLGLTPKNKQTDSCKNCKKIPKYDYGSYGTGQGSGDGFGGAY